MKKCNQAVTVKRLRSIKELVHEIGGTTYFWRSMIWAGKLPAVQIGRKQWVDMMDVEELIEKSKVRALDDDGKQTVNGRKAKRRLEDKNQ